MKIDTKSSALIVVDIQNDFCPGGALEVPNGDDIIPTVNSVAPKFEHVIATRDWHPKGHISFASRHPGHDPFEVIKVGELDQILWPDHCVKASSGAEFHPNLDLESVGLVLHKGRDIDLDSYSGFFENDYKTPTGLHYYLNGFGIDSVFVCGLAMDVCVRYTSLDARKVGYTVYLISDATRAVDQPEGTKTEAEEEMKSAGVKLISSKDVGE